jgi:hypothetical protein
MVFHPSGPASIDDDELQLALAMSRSGGNTGAMQLDMPSHQPQGQVSPHSFHPDPDPAF